MFMIMGYYDTYTTPAYKQTGTIVVLYKPIGTTIATGSVMTFKLQSDNSNCTVKGTTQPSDIIIEQRNI